MSGHFLRFTRSIPDILAAFGSDGMAQVKSCCYVDLIPKYAAMLSFQLVAFLGSRSAPLWQTVGLAFLFSLSTANYYQ